MRRGLYSAVVAATLLVLPAREAEAQQCLPNVPHTDGTWTTLPYAMPINPISATLLHTGEVLIVAGSENDADNNTAGAESYRAAIWDPTGTTGDSVAVQNLSYDVFCSGTAVLPDGRPLIVGGTSDYSFAGENRATIFDPETSRYVQAQEMVDGRWYATATALGDGRIMAWSGISLTSGTNASVEIYDLRNAGDGWGAPIDGAPSPPLFPRTFLLTNGKVFWTGQGFSSPNANTWIFDPVAGTWNASIPTTMDRSNGSAVMLPLLPPSYTPRVMSFGGGNPATKTTEIIDLSAATLQWIGGPQMSAGRTQMNAVILPDGTVLAEGGSLNSESPDAPGRTADLYDPSSNTFGPGGTAAFSRLYHSTALLLPDATVASLGSNPGSRGSYQPAIEIYTPAYLYDANDRLITTGRPQIASLSTLGPVGYGATISVPYTSASSISSAVLVRPGSSTHAFDMDQRLVGLCGPAPQPACAGSGGALSLTMPPNGNVAPPGWYMLFLLDAAGVPSHAEFIQLSPYATTPPAGVIAAPASDVTINAGQAVDFATTTSAAQYSWVFPGGSPATSTAQSPSNIVFSQPGQYVVSLTAIDASGNSDPSPPTRTVTVLPSTPDFYLAVSPAAQTVLPGGDASFTVTVTSLGGFSGPVSLSVASESGFPSGISSGGFSPATISGGGSSTLTMNTTASTTPYALSLTVTGTSGAVAHTASTTLVVALDTPGALNGVAGGGQASLSWSSVAAATGYHVKRSTLAGGPYVSVGCPASTSFTDTGLTAGTTYYYVVSALYSGGPDSGGESPDSTEISVTPLAPVPNPVPAAPTGLGTVTGKPKGGITLSWKQSTSSGSSGNRVYRRTLGGTYPASPTASLGPATSYVDRGLKSHATYCYRVTAVGAGGESSPSNESCAAAK
jgi:hypothetical protein